MPITREQILQQIPQESDLTTQEVKTKRFGILRIREWTCDVKDRWEQGTLDMDVTATDPRDRVKMKLAGSRALMFILSVCNEKGRLLFNEADAPGIGRIPASDIDPIIEQIRALNGITDAEMEEMAKNSSTIRSSAENSG